MVKRLTLVLAAAISILAVTAGSGAAVSNGKSHGDENKLRDIKHIVVIYEENHSFDNLYGGWEGVRGLKHADPAHTIQLGQTGPSSFAAYECLYQDDANLQVQSAANPSAPLSATCNNTTGGTFPSHFANAPFSIDDYISPTDVTCPPVLTAFNFPNGLRKGGINPATGLVVPDARAGGCTRDIVHRFYEEQFQLNGGQQNRYALQSDAAGLTMGHYDTKSLPIYKYLHAKHHPSYAILDNFFQSAFGGSYLNHQWLIAAAPPVCSAANGCPANATHSVLDRNGSPTSVNPPASNQPPGMGAEYTSPDTGLVNGVPDAGVRPADDAHVARLRRLQRQHAAAGLPAVGSLRGEAASADEPDDRRPDVRRKRRLGLVLGRLVERQRQRQPARLDERRGPGGDADRLLRPERRPRRLALAGVPGQPVPVPPPAVQLLRGLLDPDAAGLANRAAHLRDEQEFIQRPTAPRRAAT